jgi:Kef-type K+ transport system membrane component KefB
VGVLFRKLGQPSVVGELLAGIALGPSLLGRIAPDVQAYVLPSEVMPLLNIIAQLGIVLYMFLVGLSLDGAALRTRTRAVIVISHASIVVPFLLGIALAVGLYSRFAPANVPFTVFALFIGVAVSVTAFPVLARIIADHDMRGTELGTIALTCAAVDDVTAWCLLAVIVSVTRNEPQAAAITIGLTIALVVGMAVVARPLLHRLARIREQAGAFSQAHFAIVLVGVLVAATCAEGIGIHALFGAFMLGAMIPHDSALARDLASRLEDLVGVLLLPCFFAFTGMRTQILLLGEPTEWLICAGVIVVASVGKLGGSALAARLMGIGWRDSIALGVLMNTRGLVEIVVLNIGLDLGVLSPALFAMLVVMALVTTFATSPLLRAVTSRRIR